MGKKNISQLYSFLFLFLLLLFVSATHSRQLISPLDKNYIYIPYCVSLQDKPRYTLFGRGYHRHATTAFFEKKTRLTTPLSPANNNDFDSNNIGNSNQTVCVSKKNCCGDSLAQLMLNYASPNYGSHIFQTQQCCTVTNDNIYILKNLCHAVSYKENGIDLTAQYSHPIDEKKQWGLRAHIPIKKITVSVKNNSHDNNNYCNTNNRCSSSRTTSSCCSNSNNCGDIIGIKKDGQFAYRLDALSTYALTDKIDPTDGPLMQYGTIQTNKPVTIERFELRIPVAQRFIFNTHLSSQDLTSVETSAHVIKSCGVPPFPFGSNDIDAFIPLDEAGNNLTTGQRGAFQPKPITYRELKREPITQSTLWVVPTLTQTGELTRGAAIIDRHVQSLLQLFACNPIDTCSKSSAGVGDCALEAYVTCIKKKLFLEILFGITLPTGSKQNPTAIFELPTGTNGHAQINTGYVWFYPIHNHCTFFNSGRYNIFLPHTENILASFSKPGIRNVGESCPARIWWQEYINNIAISFHEKESHRYGATLKYQFFIKERDSIEFKPLTTNDCALETELDNPHIFKAKNPEEFRTIVVSDFFNRNKKLYSKQAWHKSSRNTHTLSAEFFWHITPHLNCFVQADHIVGGKNSPKTTSFSGGISGTF